MNERLTLQDIIDLLADKQNITKKDAETFLRELIALISETIEEKDFVRIKDFGTFKLTPVSARRSVDVNTGDPIEIPAHYRLSFIPDKELREGVNKPFSHFESIEVETEAVFEDKKVLATKAEIAKMSAEKAQKEKKKEELAETKETKDKPEAATKKTTKSLKKDEEVEKEEIDLSDDSIMHEDDVDNSLLEKVVDEDIEAEAPDEDEWDDEYATYLESQKKKKNGKFILLLLLLLLIAGVWAYFTFDPLGTKEHPALVETATPPASIQADSTATDTTATATTALVDSLNKPTTITNTEPTAGETTPSKEKQLSSETKTVTLKTGQTLRMLGREHYGNQSFWVYIFEENKAKIKRPNAIDVGMSLVLPAASKYGIDASNASSVAKAVEKEAQLFREYED